MIGTGWNSDSVVERLDGICDIDRRHHGDRGHGRRAEQLTAQKMRFALDGPACPDRQRIFEDPLPRLRRRRLLPSGAVGNQQDAVVLRGIIEDVPVLIHARRRALPIYRDGLAVRDQHLARGLADVADIGGHAVRPAPIGSEREVVRIAGAA